jgi:hypothetical protein
MLQRIMTSAVLATLTFSVTAEPTVVRFDTLESDIILEGTGSTPDHLFISTYLSDFGGGSMSGYLYTTATLSTHNPWDAPFKVADGELLAGSLLGGTTNWHDPFDPETGEALTAWVAWVQQPNKCANRSTIVILNGEPDALATGVYYAGFQWIGDDEATRYGWIAFKFERVPYSGIQYDECNNTPYDELVEPDLRFVAVGWETQPDTPITVGGGLCPSDFNFDAQINFFDISAYLAAFSAQDPVADLTGDGEFNFFDISALLSQFSTPCEF